MPDPTITVLERLPQAPGLGRHVNHDARSRRFAYTADDTPLVSTVHTRHVPVFDQGSLGSCTGNAALGCLATGPFYETAAAQVITDLDGFTQTAARWIYGEATAIDPWPGIWEPDDTGSDGLSVAKVCQREGWITGYLHAFTLDAALHALGRDDGNAVPVITGTAWYADMSNPTPDGEAVIGGRLQGGHEYVVDAIDVERERVWCTNSWGPDWGVHGRFWMTWLTWQRLLDDHGDVTIFTPLTVPPPVPEPTPDEAFAAVLRPWVDKRHRGDNQRTERAAQAWLTAKGL